jgi:hypothetical protein
MRNNIRLVLAVAVTVALDCYLVLDYLQSRPYTWRLEWFLIGGLPMASILAIVASRAGFLRACRSSPFIMGFGCLAVAALSLTLALGWFYPDAARYPINSWLKPIYAAMGSPESLRPVFLGVAAVSLLIPQLFLGVLGGFVLRRFGPFAQAN